MPAITSRTFVIADVKLGESIKLSTLHRLIKTRIVKIPWYSYDLLKMEDVGWKYVHNDFNTSVSHIPVFT